MRVVIDSNSLRSDVLRSFLGASRTRKAVLIDYASMEAYKKDPLITLEKSMAILGEFPIQVLVLKATGRIAKLDPALPHYAKRMVWERYTRTFPLFAFSVRHIPWGEPSMVAGALTLGAKAREVLAPISDPEGLLAFHLATQETFSRADIAALRKGEPVSDRLLLQIAQMSVMLAERALETENYFNDHHFKRVFNHFAVRQSLARILSTIKWIREGSPKAIGAQRLQNDAVDTFFAAYGSLFNGLMSSDTRLVALHAEVRQTLRRLSGRRSGLLLMPQAYANA